MSIQIHPVKAFEDNYIWAIHNNKEAIVVDPGESIAVNNYLRSHQLTLHTVLITHHHYDHINGVDQLLSDWNCKIYAPADDRIPFKYKTAKEGDQLAFESMEISFKVIETPGHTKSHICFYNDQWLFCGDTLFNIGCGRMFEGTAVEFVSSLNKLKALNPKTQVFCTHEYTLSNLEFALSMEPDNNNLLAYSEKIQRIREQGKPSLPTRLEVQLKLNPFLRTTEKSLQKIVSQQSQSQVNSDVQCFMHLRKLKDIY